MTLQDFLATGVFAFLVLFARIGSAIMVLPGIGDGFVPGQIRLLFALGFSVVLAPLLIDSVPALPENPARLAEILLIEAVIGVFIGLIARVLLAALDIGGTVIAFQMSLSNAFVFNPAQFSQSPIISAFLTLAGSVLLFVTDLHHLLFGAVLRSYAAFPVAGMPPVGDMANTFARYVSDAFTIGLQIAAPIVLIGLLIYIGTGLVNRLMPQIQIFFVILPLQIAVGFGVFALTASAMLLFWLDRFESGYLSFIESW